MRIVMVNACFDGHSLTPEIVAAFLDRAHLFFEPATIRSNQFSRRAVQFQEERHKRVVQNLRSAECLRIESVSGYDGPSFEMMTIASWNLQELVWRIPYEDLEFWSIYKSVSSIPGFNALLAADPMDVQWQSEESIGAYEQSGRDHSHLTKTTDCDFGGEKIDVSGNPGRRALFPGFWLQAPWQGCFAGAALCVYGKSRLLSMADQFEIRELDDGAVYVRLFDDVFSADLPENRVLQERFRDWLRLNVLEESSVYTASMQGDPTLEIEVGLYPHGGVRLFRKWIDDEGRLSRRSVASGFEEMELDEKGKLIHQEVHSKQK